ncbi:MAG: transglutaminase domain-containing protein [Butyrivibrio sp.]|nr:transglutaminase domain-containing protein [Butyrivibrio sp.]
MDKNIRSRLYTALTASVLTFSGLLTLIMSFYGEFYDKYDYSAAAMVFFAILCAAAFSALFNTVKRKWTVWAGFVLLFGIFFLINREALIGGGAIAINEVINETSGYFKCEMYYIDISRLYLRMGNEVMALYCVLLVLSALYAFCISTPGLSFIPWTLSLLLFVYPLVLEKYPKGFWVLFGIAYLLIMAVTAMSCTRRRKSGEGLWRVQLPSLALGALICLAGAFAININPEARFQRSEYFATVYDRGKELYDRYQNGELAVNKLEDFFLALNPFRRKGGSQGVGGGGASGPGYSASGAASKIGAGELGQVDELIFSGQDVLEVTTPDVGSKIYLKGYIGANYSGDRWLEPEENDIRLEAVSRMGVHSQTLTSDYLGILSSDMPINAYKTTMWVKYIAPNPDYKFMPLYPSSEVTGTLDAYDGDAGFDFFDEETGIKFVDFNQNQLADIDGAYLSDPQSEKLAEFEAIEAMYREYVYDTYLDVNTSAAAQLYEMWGGSDNADASDRYGLACAIREYLAKNCSYTTKPGRVPEGKDFVDYFLNESRQGYCTYFATSAVMMLRSAGVPARYVEGYAFWGGSTTLADETLYTKYEVGKIAASELKTCVVKNVPDSAAHAWVEYYVDGVGWVDFEVTPGNYTQTQERPTQPHTTSSETKPTEERGTTASSDKPTQTQKQTTQTGGEPQGGFRFKIKLSKTAERALICAAVFAAASFAFVLIMKARHARAALLYEKIKAAGENEPSGWCIEKMYGDYLKMLKHFGYVRKEYETETDFAARAASGCFFVARAEAERMAELYERAVFGDAETTGAQKEEHLKIHMTVRERMYGGIGIVKRLIFKYIYNL